MADQSAVGISPWSLAGPHRGQSSNPAPLKRRAAGYRRRRTCIRPTAERYGNLFGTDPVFRYASSKGISPTARATSSMVRSIAKPRPPCGHPR